MVKDKNKIRNNLDLHELIWKNGPKTIKIKFNKISNIKTQTTKLKLGKKLA